MQYVKTISAIAVLLALLPFDSTADAQERGFRNLFSTRSDEAQSDQPVGSEFSGNELTEGSGPWLIMAASFSGYDAEVKARNLAAELHQQRLRTYVYQHTFNHGGTYRGIGWDLEENGGTVPKRMKTLNAPSVTEYAVLVGDYSTVDDGGAQLHLEQIKMFMPASMSNFDPNNTDNDNVRTIKEIARRLTSGTREKAYGPLKSAFMMPNPRAPEEYFAADSVDHFVLNLNRGIDNSLLDNTAPYSVRVASFRGEISFESNEIEEGNRRWSLLRRENRSLTESKLVEATAKATLLAKELRKQGIEAYEFHDRNESYVCVGGFDYVTRTNAQGLEEYNPAIVEVVNNYKASVEDLPGIPGAVQPKSLRSLSGTGIVFDAQPVPVRVPHTQARTASRGRMMR